MCRPGVYPHISLPVHMHVHHVRPWAQRHPHYFPVLEASTRPSTAPSHSPYIVMAYIVVMAALGHRRHQATRSVRRCPPMCRTTSRLGAHARACGMHCRPRPNIPSNIPSSASAERSIEHSIVSRACQTTLLLPLVHKCAACPCTHATRVYVVHAFALLDLSYFTRRPFLLCCEVPGTSQHGMNTRFRYYGKGLWPRQRIGFA